MEILTLNNRIMSDFRPMTECKGFNMERVLLKNKNGYMITAYFKDGMLQCDGDEDWSHPIAWDSFIRLKDLANGANASDSGLHLQRVMSMLLSIAKCFDDYLEDLDPKDDTEELSEAVEMMQNIVNDNSMFIRN